MKRFRLIRSKSGSALYNMALDENIFLRYMEDGIPVLRLYSWEAPSFTYGVSQNPENQINTSRCALEGIQIAKRITGGGILFHGNEITYSLACSKDDLGEDKNIFVSYRKACAFLISFYKSLGLDPIFALESDDFKDKCAAHELCSASREKYDILINGRKIGGNAQKRRRQAVFQHGSIPLSIDWNLVRRYAPFLSGSISAEVTSLSDELKNLPERPGLEERIIDVFRSEFSADFIEEGAAVYETAMA
jgi:lipoate-protein ligase A